MKALAVIRKNKLLSLVILLYLILFIIHPVKAAQSVKNSTYYIVEMLEIMPVIFILTSLIEAWVPREVIMKGFGEGAGIKGPVLSFIMGSLSAGPIYAAFPVCKTLMKKGASIPNMVIVLSAWAVVKVPMLANEMKFLGLRFMGVRWVLTTVSIFLMAYITGLLVRKSDIPDIKSPIKSQLPSLSIREEYCIGCGICERLCPQHFKLNGGKATVIGDSIIPDNLKAVEDAVSRCPSKAAAVV